VIDVMNVNCCLACWTDRRRQALAAIDSLLSSNGAS